MMLFLFSLSRKERKQDRKKVRQKMKKNLLCFQCYYNYISQPAGGTKGTSNSNVWRFTHVLRQLKIEVDFSRRTLAIFCTVINVLYIDSSTCSSWNRVATPL